MLPAAVVALTLAAAPLNVAVLYFDNHTGRPEYDVLQKGLADMLVTDLAQLPQLRVVEREKLQELVAELDRQHTRYFDPASAARVGKLLGATHAVTGAMVAVAPSLRLDLRLVSVATGQVVLSEKVVGDPGAFFALEEELVRKFAAGLGAKPGAGPVTGQASLGALLTYSQGLDLADRGDLPGAQSRLGEVVRSSPDFVRARTVYAEILKRVRAAQQRRGTVQEQAEAALEKEIDRWGLRRLEEFKNQEEAGRYLAYRAARVNLTLHRIRRLVGARAQGEGVFVPPSKRAELARLEAVLVESGERLAADLRAYRPRGRALGLRLELTEPDQERSQAAAGVDLGEWTFATGVSVASQLAEYLVTGATPHWSNVVEFVVRPVPAVRDPALRKRADALFDVAFAELALDYDPDEISLKAAELLLPRGEGLVLAGRREEAMAHWQLFLDRFPKAEEFPRLARAIEDLLLTSEEAERDARWVAGCGAVDEPRLRRHATRLWRAEGAAGLQALVAALRGCARKSPGWAPLVFLGPATGALAEGDCATYRALREQARTAKAGFVEPPHSCDVP